MPCRFGCVIAELRATDAELLGFATSAPPAAATNGVASSEAAGVLAANAPLALSAWKGKASIAIMVDRNETQQMMDKIVAAMAKISAQA